MLPRHLLFLSLFRLPDTRGTAHGAHALPINQGDNQYQNFKLKSVKPGNTDFNKNAYYIADFQYELLTGAGFTVERKGMASVTQIGKNVQAVVAATTANRSKKIKPELEEIVFSFRVYPGNYQI